MTTDLFRDHFAYAFISKLRNLVRHESMPPWIIDAKFVDDGSTDVTVRVDRDVLLGMFAWEASVKDRLAAQPREVDLAGCIDEMMGALRAVHAWTVALRLPRLRERIEHAERVFGGRPRRDRSYVLMRPRPDSFEPEKFRGYYTGVPLDTDAYFGLSDFLDLHGT